MLLFCLPGSCQDQQKDSITKHAEHPDSNIIISPDADSGDDEDLDVDSISNDGVDTTARHHLKSDSAAISIRSLPRAALAKYRSDEDFNYLTQRAVGDSIFDRFWRWLFRNINSVSENKFWGAFLKYLLYAGCIFGLVYAVVKLTGMNRSTLFQDGAGKSGLDYLVTQDDIYAIDFNLAIQEAIAKQQFRLAVRLLYLRSLRALADEEMIAWKINKTNDQYVAELAGSPAQQRFSFLTRMYEYVWYGEVPINEERFTNIHERFIQFNNNPRI